MWSSSKSKTPIFLEEEKGSTPITLYWVSSPTPELV